MRITFRQDLASAIVRWLLALLPARTAPRPPHHAAPLDEADLAQRVRLTGEW